jgi:hypothetical protein
VLHLDGLLRVPHERLLDYLHTQQHHQRLDHLAWSTCYMRPRLAPRSPLPLDLHTLHSNMQHKHEKV